MNWKEIYQERLMTSDQAIKLIPSNSRLVLGHAAATPVDVVKAMAEHKEAFSDVEIVHMLSLGDGEYLTPDMEGHFRHNALFVGGNSRQAVNENRADYTPCFFYEVPELFKSGAMPVDVAIIQVTKPNDEGYCSYGLSSDYTKGASECAKIVIAEVNDQMPLIYGDNFIHVSEIDAFVETSNPVKTLPLPRIGEVEKEIGKHCASLIKDGDTLQLGIGAIPDAVLLFLDEKKDLGIHTEMFSDGVLSLIKKGVITNNKKTLHQGKMIATFLMGSKDLYDFVDGNKDVELYPVNYVNHPATIMQNDNMVSINSCIELDLMGQVVSESIGLKQFSGVGGQVDYVRGASMSKGGRSIIAIPSTASKGTVSRISPMIRQGSAVTTSRNDVHYVVTEYGVANLKGKTLKERAKALIDIAHPDFRDELTEAFNQRF